jgi:hypothetical protein
MNRGRTGPLELFKNPNPVMFAIDKMNGINAVRRLLDIDGVKLGSCSFDDGKPGPLAGTTEL